MKICRFTQNGKTRLGKVVNDRVVDLSGVPGVTHSTRELLTKWSELRPALEASRSQSYGPDEVTLEAPITDPQKFLAIGMNYRAHAEEAAKAGIPIPKSQLWFNKQVSCINGPTSAIELPQISDQLDYEAEMGVVIGRRCRHVKAADARSMIAGYLVADDVSVRDWQMKSPTFTLGKSFDTHGPIGPWITTDDEVADPHDLLMTLTVNGEERQRTSTGDMIYNIFEQIAYLSSVMTLEPGDLLATGTPAGVGIARGQFLKDGDVVRVAISGLGAIENRVVAER